MELAEKKYPRLRELHARIETRPRIAKYLASKRRIPFNEYGLFRHYPELDLAPSKSKSRTKKKKSASKRKAVRSSAVKTKAKTRTKKKVLRS
jgi:hypothetical protein